MTTNTPRAAGFRTLEELRQIILVLSELSTAAALGLKLPPAPARRDAATRSQ
ncbi:MAG: hypothetical protein JNK56_27280 [Myxococcales bacterium]|nr:hypothetical protein [Myxococcales bacterium]